MNFNYKRNMVNKERVSVLTKYYVIIYELFMKKCYCVIMAFSRKISKSEDNCHNLLSSPWSS